MYDSGLGKFAEVASFIGGPISLELMELRNANLPSPNTAIKDIVIWTPTNDEFFVGLLLRR